MDKQIDPWVSNFLDKLEASNGVLNVLMDSGKVVKVAIGDDLKSFFLSNALLISRVGRDGFKQFLSLIYEGKDEDSFFVLLRSMQPDDLISRLNADVDKLHQTTDDMEEFISKVEGFLMTTALRLASKALLAMVV